MAEGAQGAALGDEQRSYFFAPSIASVMYDASMALIGGTSNDLGGRMGLFEKAFWLWAGCKVLGCKAHPKSKKPKMNLTDEVDSVAAIITIVVFASLILLFALFVKAVR